MKQYDYIFTGSGLSALMTVYKMILSKKFQTKRILLLDENAKQTNDRTWCFWDQTETLWEATVSKKWNSVVFANSDFNQVLDLQPYQYNKIQGLDFYNQVLNLIAKQKNIDFVQEKVLEIEESDSIVLVKTESQSFSCTTLFNSIYNPALATNQSKYPLLQQHFVGWFIQTETPVFNPEQATFMDFSVAQKGNTRFMYILPTTTTEALLEYTLFSKELLTKEEYEIEIEKYIQKLGIQNYTILEKEVGTIPMTCYPFWKHNTKNVINIGTAGGWTKASTGFTFKNADKKSSELVSFMETQTDGRKLYSKTKFWWYDLLLLDILDQKNETGSAIFSALFEKGNAPLILKFLDEKTSFWEDLQVIWKCPKGLFISALLRRLSRF
jgi:lycopene beta-cyclase